MDNDLAFEDELSLNWYRADLHSHTVLSPCGDLEASPVNMVDAAIKAGIKILGVTDHNSLKHARLVSEIASKKEVFVLKGAEVTSKEEAHILCFFEKDEAIEIFQQYLDQFIIKIENDPEKFGYQVVVDEEENIVEEIDHLLITAINQTVEQIEAKVHQLGGLFIPAHIDRPSFSLINQLGMIPFGLKVDALEISGNTNWEQYNALHPELSAFTFIQSSDAHVPSRLGKFYCEFYIQQPSFVEITMALKSEHGRKVRLVKFEKEPTKPQRIL